MWTVTVLWSPYHSKSQTLSSSCSRVKTWPGLRGQEVEQVELLGGQVDRLAVALDGPAARVDPQLAEAHHVAGQRRGGGLGPPQHGLDARDQLAGAERLGQVVVGAEPEPEDLVALLALGRQHDDRDAALGAKLAADFQAVDLGQHQVEDHQVRRRRELSARRPRRLATVTWNPSRIRYRWTTSVTIGSSSTTSTRVSPWVSVPQRPIRQTHLARANRYGS